eukprot:6461079-Amphidinium_carterae.2
MICLRLPQIPGDMPMPIPKLRLSNGTFLCQTAVRLSLQARTLEHVYGYLWQVVSCRNPWHGCRPSRDALADNVCVYEQIIPVGIVSESCGAPSTRAKTRPDLCVWTATRVPT